MLRLTTAGLRAWRELREGPVVSRAAGVLAPVGFVMPMSAGAILMSASTVVVALNAQLLRRLDLTPGAVAPANPRERKPR